MGNVPPQKDGHADGAAASTGDSTLRGNRSPQHQQTNQRQHQQQQQQHSQQQQQQQSQQQSGYGDSSGTPDYPQQIRSQQRSISDVSMNCSGPPVAYTQEAYSHSSNDLGATSGNPCGINLDLLTLDDETVPTVFRWEHGGRQVYITGTFNGWSRQIPMHRSGNDFTYIHNLKRGKHAFKFIVDDEWRFAPDQPTVADIEGRINNFIDVSDFTAYTGDRNFEDRIDGVIPCIPPVQSATNVSASGVALDPNAGIGSQGSTAPSKDIAGEEEAFGNTMPDIDEYTKEPPPLPPHLRHIILNKPPQLNDTAALPVPQHVALNHLYCTAIKDNMMVLGVTQRYKTKFVTTVYYSPCDS